MISIWRMDGSGALRATAAIVAALLVGCAPGQTTSTPTLRVPSTGAAETIVVDGNSRGRIFDGLGGVSAGGSSRLLFDYAEPERSQILDYMFKPGYGANIQILKVDIGGDANGTVGAEASHMRSPGEVHCDRGYEWWLMEEARARNPEIRLAGLQWGAPGWFDGGFWSRDNMDYLIAWLDCALGRNLRIDYMGGWNESGFEPDWFVAYEKVLHARYPEVKIIASDNAHTSHWNVVDAMGENPAFDAATDVVGVHGPVGSRTDPEYLQAEPTAAGERLGKPLWASEYSSLAHDVGAPSLARAFNRAYIDAKITGQMIWTPVSAWYPTLPIADTGPIVAEWPWSGFYDVGKSVWVMAHTTQFTAPGWSYLDTGSERLASGATIVSFVSPDAADYTLVIEAMDIVAPTTLAVRLANLPAKPLEVWSTDLRSDEAGDHFRREDAVEPTKGQLELVLEPRHVYTISTRSGAGKGDAQPRADVYQKMELPFRATFEDLAPGRLARFFSDVSGGFESATCTAGRSGTCYRQVVGTDPIAWHGPDMPPTTIAGDARWWGDYRVSSDAMLEDTGYVELLARVDGVQGDEGISAYHLRFGARGSWRLYTRDIAGSDTTLASGSSRFRRGAWHNIAMDLRGHQIRVLLDDAQLASVRDDRHRSGQIGLRTSVASRAQFDNVAVVVSGAAPQFIPQNEMTATATTEHAENAYGYDYPASAAIDGRPETYWRSEWEPAAPLPQSITIDMGRVREVRALAYRPRISGHWAAAYPGSPITDYSISVSADGTNFHVVAQGTWRGTLAATKVANFEGEPRARYVRLEARSGGTDEDPSVTASEVEISTTLITDASPDVRYVDSRKPQNTHGKAADQHRGTSGRGAPRPAVAPDAVERPSPAIP